MIKILDTKKQLAQNNMQIDIDLLDNLKDEPVLHFYDWEKDSITYGYFINIEKFIDIEKAKKKDLHLAKRPTGGGIVFHIWDIAFSFLMPKSHEYFYLDPLKNYKFVNFLILKALKNFLVNEENDENKKLKTNPFSLSEKEHFNEIKSFDNFCMAKPTKYDVIYNGKKIVGASQRRKKMGYLHQASICLIEPDLEYLKDVLIEKEIANAIFKSSYPIFINDNNNIEEKRKMVKEKIIKTFQEKFSYQKSC